MRIGYCVRLDEKNAIIKDNLPLNLYRIKNYNNDVLKTELNVKDCSDLCLTKHQIYKIIHPWDNISVTWNSHDGFIDINSIKEPNRIHN